MNLTVRTKACPQKEVVLPFTWSCHFRIKDFMCIDYVTNWGTCSMKVGKRRKLSESGQTWKSVCNQWFSARDILALPHQKIFAMSGETSSFVTTDGVVTGFLWVESRDFVNHSTVHKKCPTTRIICP